MDIYLLDAYLPGVTHPMVCIAEVRLLYLPLRFSRNLHMKLVDGHLPGRWVSTRGFPHQGVYAKSVSTLSTAAFWSKMTHKVGR